MKTLAADTDRRIVKGDKGDKSIVMDYGLEATECEEGTTSILNETTYLAKLQDRIQPHIKIEENPAPAHERKLNSALRKMIKVGKAMAQQIRNYCCEEKTWQNLSQKEQSHQHSRAS